MTGHGSCNMWGKGERCSEYQAHNLKASPSEGNAPPPFSAWRGAILHDAAEDWPLPSRMALVPGMQEHSSTMIKLRRLCL
eukprot:6490419-Amphidinium_carterae.12